MYYSPLIAPPPMPRRRFLPFELYGTSRPFTDAELAARAAMNQRIDEAAARANKSKGNRSRR